MKQKPVKVKKLLEKYGNLPNEGAFEEVFTKSVQPKPKPVRKKKPN